VTHHELVRGMAQSKRIVGHSALPSFPLLSVVRRLKGKTKLKAVRSYTAQNLAFISLLLFEFRREEWQLVSELHVQDLRIMVGGSGSRTPGGTSRAAEDAGSVTPVRTRRQSRGRSRSRRNGNEIVVLYFCG
jgi:hypothetical protein